MTIVRSDKLEDGRGRSIEGPGEEIAQIDSSQMELLERAAFPFVGRHFRNRASGPRDEHAWSVGHAVGSLRGVITSGPSFQASSAEEAREMSSVRCEGVAI